MPLPLSLGFDDFHRQALLSTRLPLAALTRLRVEAEAHGGKVLVTLQTEEQAKYSRVIDVLDALERAKIQNVTFTIGDDPT